MIDVCGRCGRKVFLTPTGKHSKWLTDPAKSDSWHCGRNPDFPVRSHDPKARPATEDHHEPPPVLTYERTLEERIALYDKEIARCQLKGRIVALYHHREGLKEAVAILRGEDPDEAGMDV